jgi:hypothetical protein
MRKKLSSRMTAPGPVLGRRQFGKISAVEGIRLSGGMKRAFAEFDRAGLSAEERRRSIIGRFKRGAGHKANV